MHGGERRYCSASIRGGAYQLHNRADCDVALHDEWVDEAFGVELRGVDVRSLEEIGMVRIWKQDAAPSWYHIGLRSHQLGHAGEVLRACFLCKSSVPH